MSISQNIGDFTNDFDHVVKKKRLNLKVKIVVQNIYTENIFLKDLSTTFKYRVVIKVTEISDCW